MEAADHDRDREHSVIANILARQRTGHFPGSGTGLGYVASEHWQAALPRRTSARSAAKRGTVRACLKRSALNPSYPNTGKFYLAYVMTSCRPGGARAYSPTVRDQYNSEGRTP